jgi:hypothetical protein
VGAVKWESAFKCGWGGGGDTNLTACIEQRNTFQEEMMNSSSHGIPVAFVNEGLHGGAPGGTKR